MSAAERGEPRFAGRTALVTGASRGIGLAVAGRLVDEGARVVVTGRDAGALEEAVAQLGGTERALAVPGHSADGAHRAAAVDRAVATFGRLDLLVNGVGINPAVGPTVEVDLVLARKVVDVNAVAALGWVQEAHRAWMGRHGGAVVNVSSIAAISPSPGVGLYGASKAMLAHLTGQLAVELGPAIRVNAVAPALVRTRFAAAIHEGHEAELASKYPLQRLGTPEDVAGAVTFLLSGDAAWVTGQFLVVDGGPMLTGAG